MKFDEIITDRLILRKFTQESFDAIYSNMSQNEQLDILGLNSIEKLLEEKEKYKKGLSTYNKKFLYFQLLEQESRKIIGWCGYHIWYLDHKRAEIGYGLFENDYKGKGLMSEAIIPIVDYGFIQMELNRIEAVIEPENKTSIKLINRLNFVKEGLLREHYYNDKNNKMEDSIVFALLKSEYK